MASTSEHVVNVRAEWDNAVMARPGDTLVIGVSDGSVFTDDVVAEMKAELPGVKIIVVDQVTAMTVYRPDSETQEVAR